MRHLGPLLYIFLYVREINASRSFYESILRLEPMEAEPDAVKYRCGDVILALNLASRYGIAIDPDPDQTSMIVFHSTDVDTQRARLERRGISFEPTLRYSIGATATFHDPDGHALTLYEPSVEAWTWPSARQMAAVLANADHTTRSRLSEGQILSEVGPIVYLFLFVRDSAEAVNFYHGVLGLPILEEDPEEGVTKYEAGGPILSSHAIGGDDPWAVHYDLTHEKTVASVFHVSDLDAGVAMLRRSGIEPTQGPTSSAIGGTVAFQDPTGHKFYLYAPSELALTLPSGAIIDEIIDRYSGSAAQV
jgi:predicted enzyme related to lactoylglutathione lyase